MVSDDHPGIVAAVGNVVNELGGNIDSASQTVVRGYFTLLMIASLPDSPEPELLAQKVHEAHPGGSDLQVIVRRFEPTAYKPSPENTDAFVISCTGPDMPGVVLRFSQYLAGKDINIVDLYGERSGDNFVLISQVEIPGQRDISMLQADLEEIGNEMGFTVRLQHENIFLATNQLRLTRQKPLTPED